MAAVLTLDQTPVAGTVIRVSLKVINRQRVAKVMKVHVNAQIKEYNSSPAETFWENHSTVQLGPLEGRPLFLYRRAVAFEESIWKDCNVFNDQPDCFRRSKHSS